ncbi:MAG TPA: ATP-binding protein [Vicinamibacterales bacterium]|nr:ATP-binding protein [Vicinamibacterales bacterium]
MKNQARRTYQRPLAGWSLFALVGVLLCFGVLNIAVRATTHKLDDGVLWEARPEGVTAAEVVPGGGGRAAGIQPGDVLVAIDGSPVESVDAVHHALGRATESDALSYTLLRLGERTMLNIEVAPVPGVNPTLYVIGAAIGIFALLVGASVRLRRPNDPATLHFFWLCLAFFGTLTFSFSRLDRLDWYFYWADVVATLLLAPLFLHFTLVFPDRPSAWIRGRGRRLVALFYAAPILLFAVNVIAVGRFAADAAFYSGVLTLLDQLEPLYLSIFMIAGLVVLTRAMDRVRSATARRQLRWIIWGTAFGAGPFAFGYALPYALGLRASLPMELSVIPLGLVPLAFASALIRYRLMDVEVIVKRSLVYMAVILAIFTIYATLLRLAGVVFLDAAQRHNMVIAMLATIVVVLLFSPVKSAIQNTLDRAFYRDRYDYRRALVGFARDLNSDLDLDRLGERLVARVRDTFVIDRMALLLVDEASGNYEVIRAEGFDDLSVPGLSRHSQIAASLAGGTALSLDNPTLQGAFPQEELAFWRLRSVHYFVPCVSKGGTIAVLALGQRGQGEPLSSEDMGLLAAVGSHVATALENGRLYRQLQMKATELQRLQEFNENIVESLDSGLVVEDLTGRVLRWNRALADIYGVSATEAVGHKLDEVLDGPFVEALRAAQRESPAGASLYRVPLAGRAAKAGERLRVNIATAPLKAPSGQFAMSTVGNIIIVEDVTERVHLEEQLQISDKMASVGLLAAGVAHEVNTPLTGISSFTQMLLSDADPDDPKTRMLEKIEQQTFRAARIVNGLLNLSRSSGSNPEETAPVDLNAVISDVLSLLEPQLLAGRMKVRRELCPSPALVMGIEHKLQQVFLNLFLNAKDAMPKGGWLSVSTRIEDGHVLAEVGDTGSGIPSEHLSRIYDPFFTTKSIGKGTGLGLSITYGIVREHEGTLTCQSTVGQGTRFTVSLPESVAAGRSGAARN